MFSCFLSAIRDTRVIIVSQLSMVYAMKLLLIYSGLHLKALQCVNYRQQNLAVALKCIFCFAYVSRLINWICCQTAGYISLQ